MLLFERTYDNKENHWGYFSWYLASSTNRFYAKPYNRDLEATAARYWELWNLPNCIGSIDGKHIRVKCPGNSGSAYFNYKGYFSIVLLAVCDADSIFLTIDVREFGKNSDGRALKESAFGKAMSRGQLGIPDPKPLPEESTNFPHFFVADQAFPLTPNIMKPYPQRNLTNKKRIFNARLSRARNSVECAFGLLTSKFRILETPINCNVKKVDQIVQALCIT